MAHILAPKLPRKITDLIVLLNFIKNKWTATPTFTLLGLSLAQFSAAIAALQAAYTARVNAGITRPDLTDKMKTYDEQVTVGLPEVKVAIAGKFGSQHAEAQYARYGIVHQYGGWRIPEDHSERIFALNLMVSAITADALTIFTYDLAYWTALRDNYQDVFEDAMTTDGTVGAAVDEKNEQRAICEDMVRNIYHGIVAHYFANYVGVSRDWGFQSEDY